jgi:hypothetical protein
LATERERPKYTGFRTYRDPKGRYQFRYPVDWHAYELGDERDGIMFSPQAVDPKTWFSAWAVRLPDVVTPEDVSVLREGVQEGLASLLDLEVESASDDVLDNLLRFERMFTFSEDGVIRKRKMWMIYVYKWLFVFVAQGETVDSYEHWHMMLDDCFDYLDLAPALWYASDRELASRAE